MSVSIMVVNMRGQPLMPITPRKARQLLKRGKAKVLQRTPFMLQLRYATGENKQAVKLGIDPGYSQSGFSAITANKELIAGEVQLRMDISKKKTERRMYRRTRRSNKTRYKPPRFKNQRRKKGCLAPSIQHKLESHLHLLLYRVKGTHNKGKRVIIAAQPKDKSVNVTKIELVTYGKGFQFFIVISPPAKARGFP